MPTIFINAREVAGRYIQRHFGRHLRQRDLAFSSSTLAGGARQTHFERRLTPRAVGVALKVPEKTRRAVDAARS